MTITLSHCSKSLSLTHTHTRSICICTPRNEGFLHASMKFNFHKGMNDREIIVGYDLSL